MLSEALKTIKTNKENKLENIYNKSPQSTANTEQMSLMSGFNNKTNKISPKLRESGKKSCSFKANSKASFDKKEPEEIPFEEMDEFTAQSLGYTLKKE